MIGLCSNFSLPFRRNQDLLVEYPYPQVNSLCIWPPQQFMSYLPLECQIAVVVTPREPLSLTQLGRPVQRFSRSTMILHWGPTLQATLVSPQGITCLQPLAIILHHPCLSHQMIWMEWTMQSNIIVNICSLFYKKNVFMVELREFYFMLLHLVAEYFLNMSLLAVKIFETPFAMEFHFFSILNIAV